MEAALSADQVERYFTDGYFVLRGFFVESELSALRPAAPAATTEGGDDDAVFDKCVVFGCARTGEDPSKINKLEGLGRLPDTPRNSQFLSLFRRVGLDPRLKSIARQLLGAGAELMKDKYIFKGKGGGDGFPPHQDMNFIYSRLATDAVNFGVAFDAADESNGALEVCAEPGTYSLLAGRLARTPLEVATPYESCAHLRFEHVCTAPGDVVVFSGWLLHRSTKNDNMSRDRNIYYVTCKFICVNPGAFARTRSRQCEAVLAVCGATFRSFIYLPTLASFLRWKSWLSCRRARRQWQPLQGLL
jgi:hypothetical protein